MKMRVRREARNVFGILRIFILSLSRLSAEIGSAARILIIANVGNITVLVRAWPEAALDWPLAATAGSTAERSTLVTTKAAAAEWPLVATGGTATHEPAE